MKENWLTHKINRRIVSPLYRRVCAMVIRNRKACNLELFQHEHNCGFMDQRMTERCLELSLAKEYLSSVDHSSLIEVGAVTPYYFACDYDILDAYDSHEAVNLKCNLLDYSFLKRDVLSISTIEHVGLEDYGLEVREDACFALDKLYNECSSCFITWGMGYNKKLDNYAVQGYKDKGLTCYTRGHYDNNWVCNNDYEAVLKKKYNDIAWADALAVISKARE